MLNFIIGRNNSGKTEKIRALIAERASENKKCILIVPEQFSFCLLYTSDAADE